MSTVVILLETQRIMEQVTLPRVDRPCPLPVGDYIHPDTGFPRIRSRSFSMSISRVFVQELYGMVQKSPSLDQLHLQYPTEGESISTPLQSMAIPSLPPKQALLKYATIITLSGHHFAPSTYGLGGAQFPVLQAFVVVGCHNDRYLFQSLYPNTFSVLKALLVMDNGGVHASYLESVKQLSPLRELILLSYGVCFDSSAFQPHANSFESLALHDELHIDTVGLVFHVKAEGAKSFLATLVTLRHFSLYINACTSTNLVGEIVLHDDTQRELPVCSLCCCS